MDPVTASLLIKGVGTALGGLFDAGSARRQAETYGQLATEGEASIPGLEQQIEQYSIGPTMKKLKQLAAEDPISDLARTELQRRQGTAVEALKSGGAKSLFALPATMQSLDTQRRKIDADQYGRQLSTLGKVGQAEEAINRMKFQQKASDLTTARQQAGKYRMMELGAEEARRGALTGMLTSGLNTLGSLAASGAFGDGTGGGAPTRRTGFIESGTEMDSAIMPTDTPDYVKAAQQAASAGSMTITPEDQLTPSLDRREVVLESDPLAVQAPSVMEPITPDLSGLRGFYPSQGLYGTGSLDAGIRSTGTGAPFRQLTPPMVGALDLPDAPVQQALDISSSVGMNTGVLMDIMRNNPELARALGMLPSGYAKGGRLPGEFSHETNEMDVVDNNGAVVAKVAGDEVVLNPDQQKKIAKQSSFFRSLMKLPRFK